MIEWLVAADDLSGAAELGAAAARRGLATALTTGSAPEPGAAVCVVDTGTRDLPAAEAEDRLRALAPAIAAIPARLFS
jgi:uncharacterized protein YgbK (DUF1537 family)